MAIFYQSNYDWTLNFSDVTVLLHLTNGSSQTYTIPQNAENKWVVTFGYSSDSNVYVGLNSSITIPSADDQTETQFIEYKPCQRFVNGDDVLHFATPDNTAYVGISLRRI